MAQVEHAAGDQRRRAVGEHVAELDADVAVGLVDADPQRHARRADQLVALGDRPVVGERAGVVGALVERLAPRQPAAARVPRRDADVAVDDQRVDAGATDAERGVAQPGRRPRVEVDPATGMEREVGLGAHRAAHVHLPGRAGDAVGRRGGGWSKKASTSTSSSTFGPGRARSGDLCTHGPASSRHGSPLRSYCSTTRNELLR